MAELSSAQRRHRFSSKTASRNSSIGYSRGGPAAEKRAFSKAAIFSLAKRASQHRARQPRDRDAHSDQSIALQEGARPINVCVRGYGAVIFRAALAAWGRYISIGDADDSDNLAALSFVRDTTGRLPPDDTQSAFPRNSSRSQALEDRSIRTRPLSGTFYCSVSDVHCCCAAILPQL